MTNELALIQVNDIERMATAVAESGLFGMKTKQEAMALMLIASAEGLHPAIAARDYHIIHGRPSLKADAMLARFQSAGGSVDWHTLSDEAASATFSHPQGGSVKIDWDKARAQKAQLLSNAMWTKYPRQMLRARVISEGIRTVYPGVSVGMYTPEEIEDLPPEKPKARVKEKPPENFVDAEIVEKKIIDDKTPIPQNIVPLADQAKTYAELIKGALFGGELEDEVLRHAVLMDKLSKELPSWHARLKELIIQKRGELKVDETKLVSKKEKKPPKPRSEELNDDLPESMQPTAAEKLEDQLKESA